MKSSQQLLNFYKWYMGDRSVSQAEPTTSAGLCYNISVYVIGTRVYGDAEYELYVDLKKEMTAQFVKAGLNPLYPFNPRRENYEDEVIEGKCRDNEVRVAWVKQHIEDMEDAK